VRLAAGTVRVLQRFSRTRAWVAGDVMLDEYIAGEVTRVSPEAPVPVVAVAESFHRPGGAANVARNLSALGASVQLGAVVGDDAAGASLLAACREAGILVDAVSAVPGRVTPRKLRVLAQHQQLLRLDWERVEPVDPAVSLSLLARWEALEPPEVVVLSDYAKGLLAPEFVRAVIDRAGALGVPTLVGPKRRDFSLYRGASVLVPNLRELEVAVGRDLGAEEVLPAARRLIDEAGVGAIVVTLGAHGMLAVPREGDAVHVPAQRREVYDVTGAGDTVLATLALAYAAGADLATAARIASAAAGVAVGRSGTAAVRLDELLPTLDLTPVERVLEGPESLDLWLAWRRLQGRRVVFTNGCFDLLHAGHLSLLDAARAQGDALLVGLNSDASVARLKGAGRPVVPWRERAAVLAGLGCVDGVVGFDEDTPLALIRAVRPDVLVKGADYTLDQVVGRAEVEAAGGEVVLVPVIPGASTTSTLARVRASP
jgi:D-beta-D-heptose 7-phosphate kinase/D-beta-D-heptose 1-phosphate adenosyltransferase